MSMCLNPIFHYHQSKEDRLQYIGECIKGLSALEHLDLSHNTFLSGLPESLSDDLNKLQTLNLSGCIRLKKVGELESVKCISLRNCRGLESCSFVVCVDDLAPYISSNIVQLEGVNCQELQISRLENVRSKEEVRRIKLVEKEKLEKLKLGWTLGSLGSVEDSALLEELVPTNTVQWLEIHGYNGICLPEYLTGLTSLRELKIVCCAQLDSLPDGMQKLTSLKDLRVFDCPELKKWCQLVENQKILAHIPNKYYEERASTSRLEIEEDCRSTDEVEAAAMD
ncbi:Protein popC [Hordeum vulgare]|nr:Protein popC [Hordeum vulgare]